MWDERFLDLCEHIKQWSKDPSTQVGCVIIRPDKTIISLGYNGFARGVRDLPERYENKPVKYELVVHAEANAILSAKEPMHGCTMYSSLSLCSNCASMAIQSGITRVVSRMNDPDRWSDDSQHLARTQFLEAGVVLDEHFSEDFLCF